MDRTKYIDYFPMEKTICKNCVYRFSRTIGPIDPETYDIPLDNLPDVEEGDQILLEQHLCLLLQEDLDAVVVNCSKFLDRRDKSIFIDNPYRWK